MTCEFTDAVDGKANRKSRQQWQAPADVENTPGTSPEDPTNASIEPLGTPDGVDMRKRVKTSEARDGEGMKKS